MKAKQLQRTRERGQFKGPIIAALHSHADASSGMDPRRPVYGEVLGAADAVQESICMVW